MTVGLILKRMRREWRSLAILLLAVCLLTGFFALGPFYIRAVTDVGLRFELERALPQDLQITLIVDDEPLSPQALQVVADELGPLGVDYRHFVRADYNPPTTESGINDPGLATGAYIYRYGEPVTPFSPRLTRTLQPFAFEDMESLLTVVEGRLPRRLPPREVVDAAGLSDAEQYARQVGIYTRGEVEVVVSRTVAERAGLELGSRLVLGTRIPGSARKLAAVVVVGIVEVRDPSDHIWLGNRNFIEGADVEYGLGLFRYDYGLATIPEAYTDWLRGVTPGNSYIYQIRTNTDAISADTIQDINTRLAVLPNRLSAYHPGIGVLSGLTTLLEGYSGDVSETEGPIILLSGAILIMMLYHLINTVALVLEQQGGEWSAIVSRGGSIPQLVFLQLATVGLLAVLGALAGPLLSIGIMHVMERFGPLATALGGRSLGSTAIPRSSLVLSAAAALAAVLVLTLPAVPAARRSLLRLKQLISRPPTRPAWARYMLDVVLTLLGIAFMLRLYYLVGGDFGRLLNNLLTAPREVIALIADNLTETGGLNDPFNLLGPALVLSGLALLWLRFFPWLMDLVARLFRNSRALTAPLAVWNVARDPSHYAQLVLLLIGTLALGTASLGLSATRDRGAWTAAREEVGASGRVTLDPTQLSADTLRPTGLPGVTAAASLLHAVGDPGSSVGRRVHIFGVEPAPLAAAFPSLADSVAPLQSVTIPPPPGLALPPTADVLSAQVYSLPPALDEDPPVAVRLTAYVQDANGVPYRVALAPPVTAALADVPEPAPGLESAVPTPAETWLTFSGTLPMVGHPPYRLMRLGVTSTQGNIDAFEHTIYLDLLATQDVFGTSTPLEDFETAERQWEPATVANPYAASWVTSTAGSESHVGGAILQRVGWEVPLIDGQAALRFDYRTGRVGGRPREPSAVVNQPHLGRLPVVINRAFANEFAGTGRFRSAADDPLAVGDSKNLVLNMGSGSVELGFEVVGVVDDLPSIAPQQPALITHLELIQPVINQAATSSYFFTDSEIWLDLAQRQPSPALVEALEQQSAGVASTTWAWDRYGEIQREPLPSAVAGMLFAGFWISLLLSLLDFAFYLVVTARQRLFTFAVLRSLGWNTGHIWRLLFIEQIALITPALLIGSLIGAGLAYLLLPFLALVGGETLRLPWLSLAGMLLTLVVAFTALMGVAAVFLRRMSVNQVLRLGEE